MSGDDRRGGFHHRFPIGAEIREFASSGDDADLAAGDLLTDRTANSEHRAGARQRVALKSGGGALRCDGFRASLDDVEPAVLAILGPFHVHWGGWPESPE